MPPMTTFEGIARTDLVRAPLDELASAAYELARRRFAHVVTYSPKVFIPLTKLVGTAAATAPSPRRPRTWRRPT